MARSCSLHFSFSFSVPLIVFVRVNHLSSASLHCLNGSYFIFPFNSKANLLFVCLFVDVRSTQVKTYSWSNAQVVLVGNKSDMEEERVVSYERGRQLADQLGLEFFETSAKNNVNVKQVFERLVDIICEKMSESLDSDPTIISGQKPGTTNLREKPAQQQNDGCAC